MESNAQNRNAPLGLIVVDHGSRREESNELLLEVVSQLAGASDIPIIEPAHMEIAEPSISTAFNRCVERGAKTVAIFPYFLSPGRHWHDDIPRLAAAAAASHEGVEFLVTAPLGNHPLLFQVIFQRVAHCLLHAAGDKDACEWCEGTDRCQFQTGG